MTDIMGLIKKADGCFDFECFEIEFPNDCDGEDSRGITEEAARMMLRLGWLRVKFEQVITNSYQEPVFSHCYEPVDDRAEALAFDAMANDTFDDVTGRQADRMIVLSLLEATYHRSHGGDYDSTFRDFHTTYLPWAYGLPSEAPVVRPQCGPIPQFAVVMHDETYSMIHMADTKAEAMAVRSSRLGNDTLGTGGEIIDLDATVLDADGKTIQAISLVELDSVE